MQQKRKLLSIIILFLFTSVLCGIAYNANVAQNTVSKEVVVAVIDTGLNLDEITDKDRIEWVDQSIAKDMTDKTGHGTDIVSLILHNTGKSVKVMPVKVTDSDGSASMEDICEGIRIAVENGAVLINISMNTAFYTDETELEELIKELREENIYVVVSAGNERESTEYLAPANISSAIVVSAVTEKKEPFYFTNYGDTVDFCAYGIYNGKLGTSFASAYVTSFCANMLAKGETNIEDVLVQNAKPLNDTENAKYYGNGYIGWRKQYYGIEKKEESEIYVGANVKTQNNIGLEILSIDWKTLSTEELDKILGETDYKFVGLFLSRLSEKELLELKEKSKIANTTVGKIHMPYNEETDSYVTEYVEEKPFIEYCLAEYESYKNTMFVTSEWVCLTPEAMFYISSPDRTKTYKYIITGLYGHTWGGDDGGQFYDEHLSISYGTYKDEPSSIHFTQPIPYDIGRFIPDARACVVDWKDKDGKFIKTTYNWMYIRPYEGDEGSPYYGITIDFINYRNEKTGYKSDARKIVAYDAGAGVGDVNNQKIAWQYYTNVYGEKNDGPEIGCVNFNKAVDGRITAYPDIVLKPGYDYTNAPNSKDCVASHGTPLDYDAKFLIDEPSIDDDNNTFTLNSPVPTGSFGTKWYDQGHGYALRTESDIPEFVFYLAPENYTVTFDANGGTVNDYANGGGRKNKGSVMVEYDNTYYDNVSQLDPKNGASNFLGWYTSKNGEKDGGVMVWDRYGRAQNGRLSDGKIYWENGVWKYTSDLTVYAIWDDSYTFKYDGNGATSGSMNYVDSAKLNTTYDVRENKFLKTGYIASSYYLYRQSDGKYFCNDDTWRSNPADSLKKEYNKDGSENIFLNSNFINSSSQGGDTFVLQVAWSQGTCTVHYNGNGATSGFIGDSTPKYHQSFILKTNKDGNGKDILIRPGYEFTGWNTRADGSGISYVANGSDWVLPVIEGELIKTTDAYGTPIKDASGNTIAPLTNAHYEIISKAGGFALDVQDGSTAEGGNIQLWDPIHNNGQRFKFLYKGDGTYEIINVQSDLAVEVAGASSDNGANVCQWGRNGGANQRWRIIDDRDGYYHIQNVGSGKYLDVYGGVGSAGANVSQWEWNNNDSEKWRFEKVDELISVDKSSHEETLYAQWRELPPSERKYYDMTVKHHKWVIDSSYSGGGYWQLFATTGPEEELEGETYYPEFIQAPTGYYPSKIDWEGGWKVTSDMTFNAYYEPNQYTLTVDPNGGIWNGSKKIQTFNMKVGETKSIPNPTREGYSFDGWKPAGRVSGTTFKMGAEDVTITAQWKVNSYNVNVIAGYGIEEVSGGGTYQYGKPVTISAKVQKGFHWKNWTGTLGTLAGEDVQTYTFLMPAKNVTMTANAEANQYTIKFHPNDGAVVTPIPDIEVKYDQKVTLPFGTPSFVKYTIDGVNVTNEVLSGNIQVTSEDGEEVEEINEEDLMLLQQMLDEKMLELDQLKESETTTVEELSRCEMEAVALIEQVNLYESQLEALAESVTENAYPSIFKGWSLEPERTLFVPTWAAEEEMLVKTIVDAAGLENEHEVEIILYAIWDDCPWIVAEDLYYTLKEAQEGFITHDELMSHASASDRENGNDIPLGDDAVLGTSFKVIDYLPEDFTSFTAEGSVTETYQVIDSAGNTYKKMITVYIVDSTPQEVKPIGTTRFINEKYYYESYENGGLEDNSVWKTDPEYVAVIKESFENSKNDTPIISFYFTHETILEMKKFVEENGFGNTQSEDALQRFYDEFMAPNVME